MITEILVGLLLGIVLILLARKNKGEGWLYSAIVITLPLIYVTYALVNADYSAAVKELLVGAPFIIGGIACLIFRLPLSAKIIGVLWLVHGGFDIAHELFFDNPGVPEWYPMFCAATDELIGAYLVFSLPKSTSTIAPGLFSSRRRNS